RAGTPLLLHLRDAMFDEREYAVKIDCDGSVPLRVRHLIDGSVLWRPNAVVGHQDVETTEALHRRGNQFAGSLGARKIAPQGHALVVTQFLHQSFGCILRLFVTKQTLRACRDKHADGGRPDTSGTAGDECNLASERKGNGHQCILAGMFNFPCSMPAPPSIPGGESAPACRHSEYRSAFLSRSRLVRCS